MKAGKKSGFLSLDPLFDNASPKKIQDLYRQLSLEGIGPIIVSSISGSNTIVYYGSNVQIVSV